MRAADVSSFGRIKSRVTVWTDGVVNGSGVRGYIWDFSAEVNHQITRSISVAGGYYRNTGGNFTSTVNRAVDPADYSPFCVTAPVDARLGTISGQPVCGVNSISRPANQRPLQSEITQSSEFGKQTAVNNFVGGQFTGRSRAGRRHQRRHGPGYRHCRSDSGRAARGAPGCSANSGRAAGPAGPAAGPVLEPSPRSPGP